MFARLARRSNDGTLIRGMHVEFTPGQALEMARHLAECARIAIAHEDFPSLSAAAPANNRGISSPGVQTRSRLTLVGSVAFVTFVSTLAAGLRRPFRIVCKIVRIFIFTAPDLFLGDTLPPLSFLVGAGFFSLACHAKILLRSGYT
jgi:hypothetical protein